MTKSGHFLLTFYETTNCSVAEQLAIHGRYISPTTRELKCHYLKVIDLLHSESHNVHAGAETITSHVCDYIEQASLDMTKLRGIGTDGAVTMVGCRGWLLYYKLYSHLLLGFIVQHTDLI